MACFLFTENFKRFLEFRNNFSFPPRYYIEESFEKPQFHLCILHPLFQKKVTSVKGVTGKLICTSVTAVTSVTRKSEIRYLITDPTFSNFKKEYRYYLHSIRRDRRKNRRSFLMQKIRKKMIFMI